MANDPRDCLESESQCDILAAILTSRNAPDNKYDGLPQKGDTRFAIGVKPAHRCNTAFWAAATLVAAACCARKKGTTIISGTIPAFGDLRLWLAQSSGACTEAFRRAEVSQHRFGYVNLGKLHFLKARTDDNILRSAEKFCNRLPGSGL
jgi:hypothetical protein